MKKVTTAIIGLLIPFMLFSQERQLPEFGANIETAIKNATDFHKTNVIDHRLKSISVDSYSGGVWTFSDSIVYLYTGLHDHQDIDLMKLYNFMTAPDFSEFTWLEFDGVMWVNYGMGQQSFNAEELPIENEILFWTGTNWVNSSRYIYTWDIESRLTEQISQWWSSGVYENSYRYTYFYGPNGISESYYYYWSGGAWVDGDKYVYSYNGFGELEYTTRLYWNGTNYVNDHRTVFYYNPDGLVEEELYQNYNGFIWEDNDRTLYNYNPDGFLIEELVQWWNGTDWMNNYRYSAILGPNNMPDYTINEFWDGTVWQDYCRFRYTYEEYDDGTVAVPEYNISYAMKIFPNPAQRNVNILVKSQINSSGQLQIRDISGQLVGSMNVALNVGENLFQIDLEAIDLISGEYIISIRTNSKTFIGKLLVQ